MFGQECQNCMYESYPKRTWPLIKKASLAIVSEAPSVNGLVSKMFLSSRGGDVLRATLQKHGLSFENKDLHINTVVRCAWPKKKGKQLSKNCAQRCRPRLLKELKNSGASYVVALGAVATKALMGNFNLKVTEYQGIAQDIPGLPNAQMFAIEHPATLLYAPAKYKVFNQMIEKLSRLMKGTEVFQGKETEYYIVRTEEEVSEAAEFLSTKSIVAADMESTDLSPFYSLKQNRRGQTINVGIAYEPGKAIGFTTSALPYMQRVFDLPIKFIWHGGKFDYLFLKIADGLKPRVDEDAMYAHYCLNETSGTHALEQLAMHYLNVDAYKDEANQYIRAGTFGEAPEEIQIKRVCMDADYTLRIFTPIHQTLLKDHALTRIYYKHLLPAIPVYAEMQAVGFKLHRQRLGDLDKYYMQKINQAVEYVQNIVAEYWNPDDYKYDTGAKTAPSVFNPNSSKQMAWLVHDRLNLKPRLKKGRSTDADVLTSIINPPPIIDEIMKYRTIKKEHGTYVKGMLQRMDHEDRIHGTFNLHITTTGRRSSTNPNMQNIPSRRADIRRCFIAQEGFVLMEVDYSGAESRVLAEASGDKVLKALFLRGGDIHGELAEQVYGPNYTKDQRSRVKPVNFGVPYGREAKSISDESLIDHDQADLTVAEAQEIIDAWAQKYPEAWKYLLDRANLVLKGKDIVSPFGRRKRPGLVTSTSLHSLQNEYKNFTIQSTVGDFTLLASIELLKKIDPKECRIINEVHDSLVFEVLDDPVVIEKYATLISTTMSSIPKKYLNWQLPFTCDVEVGYNWYDVIQVEDFYTARSFLKDGMSVKDYKNLYREDQE